MTIYHMSEDQRENAKIRKEMHISMERILPSELTFEIFSHLPADSIIQCREVCTAWRDLIGHPSDIYMHLQRLSHPNGNSFQVFLLMLLLLMLLVYFFNFIFPPEKGNQYYYGEYRNQHNYKLRKINQPVVVSKSVVGSCNGLICFSENEHIIVQEPSYICNPITSEYVNIPRLNVKRNRECDAMVCGFGYHTSTKKYKIIKICHIQNQPLGKVTVYTLGSGSGWRYIGKTAYSLRPTRGSFHAIFSYRSPFGALANGALHWLTNENKILSFDLANENLNLLPFPLIDRTIGRWDYFQLEVLGGCLCFVHKKPGEPLLDIWFLRKQGESGTLESFDLNEQDDYDSLIWIKKFSIPTGCQAAPCALTNSGEVLLLCRSSLFCYNPETANLERLIDEGISHVFPHMNRFVSLKALGENCKLRKRYGVNPAPKEIFLKLQREEDTQDTSCSYSLDA
ncbi:F-box protein At3g07870-like [Papaver somniferum]|uniref:F-box protein At3g07870-like n=1 Tax=Papaver somniferum TaxID=3469 RepID=UPI000E6F7CD1|nr:F-box protein At3g07870-like [Papaver somniferum]